MGEAGFGCWELETHATKGGRPARRFRLVSAINVTETPSSAANDVEAGDGDTEPPATAGPIDETEER